MRLNQQGGNLAMQKKTVWMGAGAVLLLGALLAWAFAPRPQEVEVAAVVQGRFEAGIDEDARTRLRDRYAVSAPLAGRLERMALREGDAVQAGDVVARIQPALPALLDERGLREQQARVAAALAGVQRAAVRSERSRAVLAQAQGDLRRTEQLAQQGFVAPTRLDAERLAAQVARKDVDVAEQEQQVARADLAQARAALDVVQRPGSAAGRAFEVRAPVAGRVLRVAQASEGMVGLGTVLVEVGDTAQLEVVAPLLSTDALQVRPGSPVRIERWGGPGTLQGRVRSVEPAAFTKVSALGVEEQRVNVLIDLTSPPAQWAALGDGYRVVVRVLTREAEGATLVPVSALFPLPVVNGSAPPAAEPAAPRMAVFVVDQGHARRVPVVLEARGSTHAWVKEGLQAGAQVVVYPPAALADGGRVRLRTP
jgi:HlyD family secretion protein